MRQPMASMFKADWTERPAVKVWRDLVKGKWWTRADLISDAKGEGATTAFFGWYDVTVEHNGRTTTSSIHFPAGEKAVTIKLE